MRKISGSDDTDHRCPKCNGQFEQGYLADSGYILARKLPWVKEIRLGGLLTIGEVSSRIVTSLRCKLCGYLENYAE